MTSLLAANLIPYHGNIRYRPEHHQWWTSKAGQYFTDGVSKYNFLNFFFILIQISLKYVLMGSTDKTALAQVRVWYLLPIFRWQAIITSTNDDIVKRWIFASSWIFPPLPQPPPPITLDTVSTMTRGPFYWHGSPLIPAWIRNYIHCELWD